jgi:molybdate transport system substrate-binding protein
MERQFADNVKEQQHGSNMENSKESPSLKVACTNGLKGLLLALDANLQKSTGHRYEVDFSSTKKLMEQIAGGVTADVVIATDEAIDALTAQGKLAGGRTDIAKSFIGVAVRHGMPKPDISTVAAFIETLRRAPSISRSRLGISGLHVVALVERLGLAQELTPKIKAYDAYAGQACANGEVDLAIQQISELLPVKGLDVVGPLPDELQKISIFSAGIAADTRQRAAASAFIDGLTAKNHAAVVRANGLEPI